MKGLVHVSFKNLSFNMYYYIIHVISALIMCLIINTLVKLEKPHGCPIAGMTEGLPTKTLR